MTFGIQDAGKNTLKEVESTLIPQLDKLLYNRRIDISANWRNLLSGKGPFITITWELNLRSPTS